MAIVTHGGASYSCATAIKGSNYVRLVDSNGVLVASFEGVSDFTGFSISGGSWTDPTVESDCKFAVIGNDGLPHTSNYCPKHFLAGGHAFDGNIVLRDGVQYGTTLPSSGVEGQLFFKVNVQ